MSVAGTRVLVGLALGASCAIAVACGASAAKQASPTTMGAAPEAAAARPEARERINQLEGEIRADLARMGLPEEPDPATAPACGADCNTEAMTRAIKPPTATATCTPGTSSTCQDSCKLADAICSNASKICTLASQLGDDPWANEKCASGKSSCDRATTRCCGCVL